MDALNRSQAPFPAEVWEAIDEAAVEAASDMLTGRRFLEVEGPFGVGLTAIEVGNDDYCREPSADEAAAVLSRSISVPMLRKQFRLSLRRLAAYHEQGQPLNLKPVEDAAEAIARREEEFIYYGQQAFGVDGILNSEGRCHRKGGDWANLDHALKDVLTAVTSLDEGGFRGPYALVLEPKLYNNLFRRYDNTDMLQVEHLSRLCTKGIYKANVKGAAVIDPRVGKLIIGQDLRAGYSSQDGIHCSLYLTESLVVRLDDPGAVCTIEPAEVVET
ncbi:family 1 encapsulin nanocompartment shell protein [Telmatospirillum sp. J64-1]|uniref:family 1 encapsulin nanocompartment shell protein n=1 Tax=Telmatospirillum sp. J64-1 TaxID=2502183 RepID=UPI00115E0F3D|nr:family 1 encapsulin nanocompartment shell protein [Telmatospirillum sp. J64-1]